MFVIVIVSGLIWVSEGYLSVGWNVSLPGNAMKDHQRGSPRLKPTTVLVSG